MINNKGFSILEVLVAAAISLMMFLGFASLSGQMSKEMKHSDQRADALEFRTAVTGLLADLQTCSCQLNLNLSDIDLTGPSPNASLSALKTSCKPTASLFAAPNQAITGSNSRLTIDQIRLIKIESLGVLNKYRGRLSFGYKSDNLLRAIPGFDVEVRFSTDPGSPASAKRVLSCDFVGGASGTVSGICPPGQFVTGISGGDVLCSGVAVAGSVSNKLPGFTALTPGKGCSGMGCVTADFGPCSGMDCLTNGAFCSGLDCTACGPGATCSKVGCCAGPACPKCKKFGP
jgi:hypothetical protein